MVCFEILCGESDKKNMQQKAIFTEGYLSGIIFIYMHESDSSTRNIHFEY